MIEHHGIGHAARDLARIGQIEQARVALGSGLTDGGIGRAVPLLTQARIAIERGDYAKATRLLCSSASAELLAADVLLGDVLVRTGRYDDHYELVFRLARTYQLGDCERAWLAVQTGELAVLAANENLAVGLFRLALDRPVDDPLLKARAFVGYTLAGLLGGAGTPTADAGRAVNGTYTPADVLREIADHLNPSLDPEGLGLGRIAETLERVGLIDLSRRVRIVAGVWMAGGLDPTIEPLSVARCPWVTSGMLQRRLERSGGEHFDFWSASMELRLAEGPHPSLVNETADVIGWSEEIHEQHQANLCLSSAVEQAQAGWRELANLTSNEIRGLLTSLEVVTDLRQVGAEPPPGLELALVHRVAALTTMTQLGASSSAPEADWPVECATPAGPLLTQIVEDARPMFDWTDRSLVAKNDIADDVVIDVHPGLLADLIRWLLISATTGSLRRASVEVVAENDGESVRVAILSRTPEAPLPEQERELGLGQDNTAHRAAVAILDAWGGTFSAVYSVAGLDVTIELPAARV